MERIRIKEISVNFVPTPQKKAIFLTKPSNYPSVIANRQQRGIQPIDSLH